MANDGERDEHRRHHHRHPEHHQGSHPGPGTARVRGCLASLHEPETLPSGLRASRTHRGMVAWCAGPTTDVPIGNTYDKYASSNPVERRLMAGFFGALDAALPTQAPAPSSRSASARPRWPDGCATASRTPLRGDRPPGRRARRPLGGAGPPGVFADIARLPFPPSSFDLVLGIEVLEHVPDPVGRPAGLGRLATGDVVLSIPGPIWRIANMARGKYLGPRQHARHINHWGKRSFAGLIGDRFAVRSVASPFPWTMVAAPRPRHPLRRPRGTRWYQWAGSARTTHAVAPARGEGPHHRGVTPREGP